MSFFDAHDKTQQNPMPDRYWDGEREALFAFAAVVTAAILFFNSVDVSWLSRFWKIGAILLVAMAAASVVKIWVSRAHDRAREKVEITYRVANSEQRVREIKAAKKRGDFKRFGKGQRR